MHARGDLSHFLEEEVAAEIPWEPIERYLALAEVDAVEEAPPRRGPPSAHLDALGVARDQPNRMLRAKDATPTEYTYDPVSRYNALAHTFKVPKGAKTAKELEILRVSNPAYGTLAPRRERPGPHEVPYDPVRRFAAMSKTFKLPRGSKSAEHLAILRLSDPAYGSLTPSKERPGPHELSYDPLRRFAALAKTLKPLRGAKTTEHLTILRLSDPAYGSLTPSKERPGPHELSYDPVRRYASLAKTLKGPRGEKPFEHLRNVRLSDPSLGSLAPRRLSPTCDDEDDAAEAAREAEETAEYEAMYLYAAPRARMEVAPPQPSLRVRTSSLGSSGFASRLPRILSNQAFEPMEDDDDDTEDLLSSSSPSPTSPQQVPDRYARGAVWAPPPPMRNPQYYRDALPAHAGPSGGRFDDERDSSRSERDSLFSAAPTYLERMSERSSNDTIASFLDDHDVSASGEWSRHDMGQFEAFGVGPPAAAASRKATAAAKANKKAAGAAGSSSSDDKRPTPHAGPPLRFDRAELA